MLIPTPPLLLLPILGPAPDGNVLSTDGSFPHLKCKYFQGLLFMHVILETRGGNGMSPRKRQVLTRIVDASTHRIIKRTP
jgi:hypothetical protein